MSIQSLPSSVDLTTTGDSVAKAGIGQLYVDDKDQKAYRYIFNNNGGALSTAVAACWDGATGKENGQVVAAGNSASKKGGAGMPMAAIADQKFGWIQVRGKNANCDNTPGAIAAGGVCMLNTSGQFITQTAGNQIVAVNDGAATSGATGQTLRLCFE